MTDPSADPQQHIFAHLSELRTRLLWSLLVMAGASIVAYVFVKDIYGFLVKPLAQAMGPQDSQRLIYTDLTEAFFTYIKVAIFTGCFITFPFILMQIWRFVSPGLFSHEKNTLLPFLIGAPVLFFLGGSLVYFFILPVAFKFFLSFQSTGDQTVLPIMLEAKVGEYLDLIMVLIFAFGICFQLPVIMGILAKGGLVTPKFLAEKRRYAIVIIFTIAAFITPPDVISQISLAIPLMGLYELSILLVKYMNRHEPPAPPSDGQSLEVKPETGQETGPETKLKSGPESGPESR